jgi:DNA-binding PadR family transcriptional regulator
VSREYLGEFEHILLLAVLHLEPEAHGARIRRGIRERTGRSASLGAIYSTLRRLAEKGYVTTVEVPSPRGGRPRRLSRVTGPGLRALQRSRAVLEAMAEGLEGRLADG